MAYNHRQGGTAPLILGTHVRDEALPGPADSAASYHQDSPSNTALDTGQKPASNYTQNAILEVPVRLALAQRRCTLAGCNAPASNLAGESHQNTSVFQDLD